jgi:hypothetical protein
VRLYKFRSETGHSKALTRDPTGANLPGENWVYEGATNVDASDGPRIGASLADIVKGVERDGYFIWPA